MDARGLACLRVSLGWLTDKQGLVEMVSEQLHYETDSDEDDESDEDDDGMDDE